MISVIGTGAMGSAVAEGLLRAGREVTVYNRTRSKTKTLEALGATVAESAAGALEASDSAIVVLPDAASTRELLFASSTAGAIRGSRLLNVAHTTAPEIISLADEVRDRGGSLAEVNVTVYPDPVRNGSGHFNVAASEEDSAHWMDVFGALGKRVHFVGPVGNASRAESALWLSFMFNPVAVAYSAAAFKALGLPHEALISALSENPTLRITGAEDSLPQMVASSYADNTFSIDNFAHSVVLTVQDAEELGLPTKPLRAILELIEEASRKGHGGDDIAAVVEAMASPS